jgi:AcrR family transcriptional regulator
VAAQTLRKIAKTADGGGRKSLATGAKPRRTGRPSAKDENVGPQKLVEAARELLQTVAPAMLTAGQVAKAAGADRALIRYYFGSMSNLLGEVAAQLSRGLVTNLSEASSGEDSALARLKRRIHEFVRYEVANPALHPLYAQQILSGKAPGAKKTLESVAAQGHTSLQQIIADGRRNGELRDDFDPRLLDVAIIGLCEFIVVGRPFLDAWATSGESSADLVQRYADFVVELVSRGIASDGEPPDDRRGTAVGRGPASARLGERKIPVEGPERRRKP